MAISVTVWNEFRHERRSPEIARIYPQGIHGAIAEGLRADPDIVVRTATLDDRPDHGLSEEVLAGTQVLVWWGHLAHEEVADEVVARIHARVLDGMGLIALHSAHLSKIFRRLMGTSCMLKWREAGERERLWVVDPAHPIAAGLGEYVELPAEEMYGEFFDVPEPDRLVFISWFRGGEVFRSGLCYHRGKGRIFYFRPGHETYPTYHNPAVRQILRNAVRWACPRGEGVVPSYGNRPPLEPLA